MASHLSCERIRVSFGGVVACDHVSLDVEEGKIVGLIGPNGAGKTTLFNCLSRFQEYEEGSVKYRGQPIDDRKPHHMIELGMARTFQNINLFGDQSTLDNILIGAHHRIGNPFANMLWTPGARRNEKALTEEAIEIAERLRLHDELDNQVKNLPYGYQKRVEIARALAAKPSMILLDEPSEGLAPVVVQQIAATVRTLAGEGLTVLLSEQNVRFAAHVADRAAVIERGRILVEGPIAQIAADAAVREAYLTP